MDNCEIELQDEWRIVPHPFCCGVALPPEGPPDPDPWHPWVNDEALLEEIMNGQANERTD